MAAEPVPGHRIIVVSWTADGLFAVTAIPAALGVSLFDVPAVAIALALFAISLVVWVWAFAVAVARTTRGDDVVVGSLFLVQGPVPGPVRWHLYGSLVVCVAIAAATAVNEPFGTLVPMLPLGLAGFWGARYGTYPPRRVRDRGVARGRSSARTGQ